MNSEYFDEFGQFIGGIILIVLALVILHLWRPLTPLVVITLWRWWLAIKNAVHITFAVEPEPYDRSDSRQVIYPHYLWAHSHWPWM